MSDDSPTKKRKANDGRATVPDSNGGGGGLFSSWLGYFSGRRDEITSTTSATSDGENLTQKMDAMMQIMSRMEEKCSRLETECSSLKSMLVSLKEHVDSKIDKQNEYNYMIVKNQSWKYSTPVHSVEYWENNGYDGDTAQYLADSSDCLKVYTECMRRGEFPDYHGNNKRGIELDWGERHILDNNASMKMRHHWIEFADGIKQFDPVFGILPDDCETYFTLQDIQLASGVPGLLKDALMHKPFQKLCFVNRDDVGDNVGDGRMTIDSIMDIMDSNKHLRKIIIGNNRIQLSHIEKICSTVNEHSLVQLDLRNCFENGLGDDMIASLLRSGGLAKLERLDLESNGITSNGITSLANFLATNPMLKELDLMNNDLRGDCVDLLANALRSNTSLRFLHLYGNTISDAGREALRLVLHDDSSLNSIADSNHSCSVIGLYEYGGWNINEKPESFNRARKIYRLLSARNKSISTSNVQHFDDIDIKILPFMLKALQRYASVEHPDDHQRVDYCRVEALSIVYEVMRKWDKVFPLYTD